MDANMEVTPLSFPVLLLCFTAYYFIEYFIQAIFYTLNPTFYAQLVHHRRRLRYFAHLMELLNNLISTPACTYAFVQSSPANDQYQNRDMAGQICIASRGVLWVSELNRLDHTPIYVAHHGVSLISLAFLLLAQVPLRPLYVIHATLATEIISNTRVLMSLYGFQRNNSRFARTIKTAYTVSLVLVRLPVAIYGWTTMLGDWCCGWVLFGVSINMALYTGYILYWTRSVLQKSGGKKD